MKSKLFSSPEKSAPSGGRRCAFRISFLAAIGGAVLVTLIAGCGWHLRGQRELAFETVYVQAPETSLFATELRRAIRGGTQARVVDKTADAQITLQIIGETRTKDILSLTTGGRVAEFALNYRVIFRVYTKSGELMAPSDITLRRAITFNDSQVLARESEEALLYRDMQNDAVQQVLRRLQSVQLEKHEG